MNQKFHDLEQRCIRQVLQQSDFNMLGGQASHRGDNRSADNAMNSLEPGGGISCALLVVLRRYVLIAKHNVGAPAAEQLDQMCVHLGAQKRHGASSP
jgi:hypothetical protein